MCIRGRAQVTQAATKTEAELHGRPVCAGKPYDTQSDKLYLVVVEDENATKGTYAVDYLEEPDAVVVGVREIVHSRPDPKAKPDPRPVSYTHLDVYKRQGPCRCRSTSAGGTI